MKFFEQAGFFRSGQQARMPLRDCLRSGTRKEHARLDETLAALDLGQVREYARFLRFHLVARTGVEKWLRAHAPEDMRPPEQTPLIAHDLVALGEHPPTCAPAFAGADAEGWLGVAYVIAGSHLGNRVLLGRMDGDNLPTSFLGGLGMGDYWKRLRPLLEDGAPADETGRILRAARATFGHFSRVAATTGAVLPA